MSSYRKRQISQSMDSLNLCNLERQVLLFPQTMNNYKNFIEMNISRIHEMKQILHHVAWMGRTDIMRTVLPLLSIYLNTDSNNGEKTPPLYFAIINGHVQMSEYLVNMGAKLNKCGDDLFEHIKCRYKFNQCKNDIIEWFGEQNLKQFNVYDHVNINWFDAFKSQHDKTYI